MTKLNEGTIDSLKKEAVDLYWLCFLLTGRRDLSSEIVTDTVAEDYSSRFFDQWMRGWSRRIVLARALVAIRTELAESARRTRVAREEKIDAISPLDGDQNITKAEIEEALFAIDLFPRAALILLVFEGVRIADAVSLLDADTDLIRKGQAIGLQQLTRGIITKRYQAGESQVSGKQACPSFLRSMQAC